MSNIKELSVYELTKGLAKYMQEPDNAEKASFHIYENLVQEILLDIIFEVHFNVKTGNYNVIDNFDNIDDFEHDFLIVNQPGLDIFGQNIKKKKQLKCISPMTTNAVSACRFAKHLQDCFGEGRKTRLAQHGGSSNSNYSGNGDNYDDDDFDSDSEKPQKKSSSRKNGSKKSKSKYIVKKEDGLECMTPEERRNILGRICGVISEHTKKLCARSTQCPQHTQEQKRAVREAFLDHNKEYLDANDTEDGRSVSVSPADSGSNSNSGSTQRRKKEKPQRGRPPKTRRSCPSSPSN